MKTNRVSQKHPTRLRTERPIYPFAAIVGQEEMKLGLLLNAIDPKVGGVLIMGHRGTGKSTAVRALADLLPQIQCVRGCLYGCDPSDPENLCVDCRGRLMRGEKLSVERAKVQVVDLPLGATEDRVCGAINIESALVKGLKAFEPGLLARAHRGFLYIDEVNLLEDHLVDLLLDAAATGRNVVERESVSVEHPSRFVLIGSGNPEEGELRPQLLDRFGLHVEIKTTEDLDERLTIVERRQAFEGDALGFRARWEGEQNNLRRRILRARRNISNIGIERELMRRIAELCLFLKVEGHRGELTITRAARALAAFEGRRKVNAKDIERVALMSLRHRLRRDPLEQTPGSARIEQALEKLLPSNGNQEPVKRKDLSDDIESDDFSGGLNRTGDAKGNGARANRRVEQEAPTEHDVSLGERNLDLPHASSAQKPLAASRSARRQGHQAKAGYNTSRGRYTRATRHQAHGAKVALDATLRATMNAVCQEPGASKLFSNTTHGARHIAHEDLRYKLFQRKAGTLFIFAIDTSGSMALNRIRQAKGALAFLLERSYIRRDHIALVSFRGVEAEVLLSPSQSTTRARRLLDALPVGGATPLASGLAASLQLARRATRQGRRRIVLFLFTDGRANVSMKAAGLSDKLARRKLIREELEQLGAALKSASVSIVIVDTQTGYTSKGEGRALATILNAQYLLLPIAASTRENLDTLAVLG